MEPMDVLRSWAVKNSPPGAATAALVARGAVEVGWLDRDLHEQRTVVALYNARSATAVLPADEVAAYGTALLPVDDAGLKAVLGRSVPEGDRAEVRPSWRTRRSPTRSTDVSARATTCTSSCARRCRGRCCRGARAVGPTMPGAGC